VHLLGMKFTMNGVVVAENGNSILVNSVMFFSFRL